MTKYRNTASIFKPDERPVYDPDYRQNVLRPPSAEPVVARQRNPLVLPEHSRREQMSSMAGAEPLAALTATPGSHMVEFATNYNDRAAGFVRSTLPLWWAVSGASAALVLVVWIVGPLKGWWAFTIGWWITSEILVLALTSVGVWAAMWWRWHHDSPDAIASRSADARLRMAEAWFNRELARVYGDDK